MCDSVCGNVCMGFILAEEDVWICIHEKKQKEE